MLENINSIVLNSCFIIFTLCFGSSMILVAGGISEWLKGRTK